MIRIEEELVVNIKTIDAKVLSRMFLAGAKNLEAKKEWINELNVFPVPDGDTGTNMSMTLQAVENELIKLNHEPNMKELVEIVSEAILLGARGNSGTILSQIIQGFLSSIEDKEEITVDDVIKAFGMAKERAYQAVSEPVEGTMLTVIRRVAEEAAVYQGNKDDFILFLVHLKNVAKEAVEETPNLLPKLKEAGVVDAGGKGIFYVLELSENGKTQLRIAETEKYAHVTFFFNGGVEAPYEGEDRCVIPSPKVATYDLKPEMSAPEVAAECVKRIESGKYDVVILNFANCDMVGHTGVFEAAVKAVEAVDTCVDQVVTAVLNAGGCAFITADHGNAEKMMNPDGTPFTAHTTNVVPFVAVGCGDVKLREGGCLADIAPTMLPYIGLPVPAEMTGKSIIVE